MSDLVSRVRLPAKLVPVFAGPAQYRGAFGGRGSGKTRSFALMAAIDGHRCAAAGEGGLIVCGRELQKSLADSSFAEVRAAIEETDWLRPHYDIGKEYIRTIDGRVEFVFLGLRYNVETIKSMSRIRRLWVDEAEPVPESSWQIIIPSIREEGSEIWVTWNPERKASATNQRFRIDPPAGARIVELNWRDNPWFPSALDEKRLEDKQKRLEQYAHVWEGDYATAHSGAYYAALLADAEREGRIGRVARDPLLPVRAFCDLGGTGAKSDAFAIWIVQFVAREIRVLDYYEAVGQPLATHVEWLRDRKWDKAQIVLPHDGATNDRVYDVSFESAFRSAGFDVRTIPNQGKGAARMRIESARRLFPMMWFNKDTTEAGRDALGWYHEKRSEDEREIGLGPEHDWCLAAGTEVLTPIGWRTVESISVHDEVLTPCGVRRIVRSGIVRETNEWVTVKGIRCTPEHRFFTSRGLIAAADCRSFQEGFWTRDAWGLRALAFLCVILSSGLKTSITLATPRGSGHDAPCSFIGWCTRLFTAKCRMAMKSTILTAIRSIITQTTLRPSRVLPIAVSTSQNNGISVFAGSVEPNSDAINHLGRGAAKDVSESIMLGLSASVAPAYNLTVDVDECYFVRGEDNKAYLVSNSSHSADAFGLMCIVYETPVERSKPLKIDTSWIV